MQAFRQALYNNGGGQVIAADINKEKLALYYADDFYVILPSKHPEFISKLKQLCVLKNIQLIVPTRDGELSVLALNRLLFEQNRIQVMVADTSTIEICQDKYLFYQYCIEHGFKTIPTSLDPNSEIEFPIYIKPRIGSAAKKHFIAQTAEKMKLFLALYHNEIFVLQPRIDHSEYTIDLFSDFSGNIISVIPRKRVDVENGESIVAITQNNQYIIKESSKLAYSLKLIGHNTIQCFFDEHNNDVIFIEVNPRYGGGAALGFSVGASTANYLVQLLKGETPEFEQNSDWADRWMFKYPKSVSMINKNDNFCQAIGQRKIFCIDIDGTICTEHCSYEDAQPINSVIEKVNSLFQQGHKIILFTSRGYSSGYDWLPLLKQQMLRWKVSYHEIRQGKPYADYYIDNKAVNILDWV